MPKPKTTTTTTTTPALSRRKFLALAGPTALLGGTAFLACCESSNTSGKAPSSSLKFRSGRARTWESRLGPVPETHITPARLYAEAKVRQRFVPKGRYSRRYNRPMRPTYITIHSTQNYTGDAWDHAKALSRGALRVSWHFTVQEDIALQHLPTNQQGRHADLGSGPGNRTSIGVEMCEHRGNDIVRTIERTAKLTAHLMYTHRISIRRVVPHYHWPRRGYKPPNKNCPHFLLDNGRPGATWSWFVSRVDRHYKRLYAKTA